MDPVSAHFQHTTNSEQKGASESPLKAVENGGRGWILTIDPCRVKAALSLEPNVKSTTTAHRSRVYVTGMDPVSARFQHTKILASSQPK